MSVVKFKIYEVVVVAAVVRGGGGAARVEDVAIEIRKLHKKGKYAKQSNENVNNFQSRLKPTEIVRG